MVYRINSAGLRKRTAKDAKSAKLRGKEEKFKTDSPLKINETDY